MKINKQIQRKYAEAFRNNDVDEVENIFLKSNEKFVPMYVVGHGFLSSSALKVVKEETVGKTIQLWDLSFKLKDNTVFSWLYSKRFDESKNFIVWIFKYGAKELGQSDLALILRPKDDKLIYRYPFNSYLHLIPKSAVEAAGLNYFLWIIKHGPLAEVIKNYSPGDEFLEEEDGTKLLCYLPNSRLEIRSWMFANTQIAEDPLFDFLGIKVSNHHFLSRPWQKPLFNTQEKNLKTSLGISSNLLLKTLQDKCSFPITKGGDDCHLTIDFFNAVFIIKKIIPEIDENILNNALQKVLYQRWNINLDALPEIIQIVWDNFPSYSVERRLRLILTANISLSTIEDLARMIKSKSAAAEEFEIRLLPKKPKSLYYIHNYLTKIPELLTENRKLRPTYKNLLEGYQQNQLRVSFPQTEVDLVKIGIDLNICVGSEYYRSRAVSGECDIFTIKDNETLIACVEVVNSCDLIVIEQVSGEENKAVSEQINQFILTAFKEKVPDNFVSFYFRSEDEENY